MTGPKGDNEFCFPETLNVPQGGAEGNIEVDLITCESKVQVVVSLGSFVRPRELESFDQRHVTRSRPVGKRI